MKPPINIKKVYIIAVVGFVLDQITKFMARADLADRSIDFGLLRFDLVFNTGAAYGLFADFTNILLWLGVLAIGYILYSLKTLVQHPLELLAFGCILAGALGNTFDRLVHGKVTDFINIHVIPVFNLADVFLNIGIGLIIFHSLFYGSKKHAN